MGTSKHIGHQVMAMMDRMGVSPITRNYHLFYVCIANSDPRLRQAVRNLGRFPTQQDLDQVIEAHCPEAVDSGPMRRHENAVLAAVQDLGERLHSEQSQLTGFNRAIESVTTALSRSAEQDKLTTDLMLKVVKAIGQASSTRAAAGRRTLERMERDRTEVDNLRDELLRVRRMANTDVLTGLANRRHFDERLASALGKSQAFALMLADIDYFKTVNDTHGHAFGDHVLKGVAASIQRAVRTGTFVARTGGEEFAIVLPGASAGDAEAAAERIRESVHAMRARKGDEDVPVTVSIGVALTTEPTTAAEIYEAADAALYRAKNSGRNRVVLHDRSAEGDTGNRYQIYAR